MKESTKGLTIQSKKNVPLETVISNNSKTFAESKYSTQLSCALNKIVNAKNLRICDIIRDSSLSTQYTYEIFRGDKKNPSRDVVLSLCIGMHLIPEEADRLMLVTGYAQLYNKNLRDFIIFDGLEHNRSISQINSTLFEHGLQPLSKLTRDHVQ